MAGRATGSLLRVVDEDLVGPAATAIEILPRPPGARVIEALAALLVDAVDSGASVCFRRPLSLASAAAWWRRTLIEAEPRAVFLAARADDEILGSVHLVPAWAPNARHRAQVAKLLVHRGARRRGIGRALMAGIERHAAAGGFSLLTLDTRRGDAGEQLYRSLGWTPAGIIPGYAIDHDGRPNDNVVFYRAIGGTP